MQAQPLQVLRLLLQAEGKVVPREEIRNVLWPEDTFVDFDLGVNTAVKKLRQALSDPADDPKFIETLPRIGYRFLVPVEWVPEVGQLGGTAKAGVWKIPTGGGEQTRVTDEPEATEWCFWTPAPGGIYFVNQHVLPNGRIEYFDFSTGPSTTVLTLDKPTSMFGGLALSPDGKTLLFGQNELDESYVMLAKDFR